MILQAVIRAALAKGALGPHEIETVQMHGTGTALGDPIEVGSTCAVLRRSQTGTNSDCFRLAYIESGVVTSK